MHELTAIQHQVIAALSAGATTTAAAHQAGVHRNSIGYWRRTSLPFREALEDAQYDKALLYQEHAEETFQLAFKAIHDILSDPKSPAGARLKAAIYVMEKACTPPPAPKDLPVRTVQPDESEHKTAQDEPAATQHSEAVAPKSEIVHNSAQRPTPIRRDHAQIGRNEACPCGSGQKFKRCCIGKESQMAAAA